jgi:hypothetical protein
MNSDTPRSDAMVRQGRAVCRRQWLRRAPSSVFLIAQSPSPYCASAFVMMKRKRLYLLGLALVLMICISMRVITVEAEDDGNRSPPRPVAVGISKPQRPLPSFTSTPIAEVSLRMTAMTTESQQLPDNPAAGWYATSAPSDPEEARRQLRARNALNVDAIYGRFYDLAGFGPEQRVRFQQLTLDKKKRSLVCLRPR